jgi:4-hydroxyphenylpyruvate dioxygenase
VPAIGVESEAPMRSADRAQHLRAPLLPRDRGPGEADLSAIAAPDGTSVFFCRTEGDGWLTDFLTAGPPGGGISPHVSGIDHVALSQPFDFFDEAVLFYRSVLGLELQNGDELATPDGLVRSRAARSRDGSVRFALSVPVVGSQGFEFQHVALASDDVLTAAEAMRDRGVPLLAIHDNYYDDLQSRTQLEPDTVERMRAVGVLHDATDDGELFHVYTEMVGPGLFFELVERRGAYDGYGAASPPVRVG